MPSPGDPNYRYSVNEHPTDGVQTTFEVSFAGGYIDKSFVNVRFTASDGSISYPTFSWTGAYTITTASALPDGGTLMIFRNTPVDKPLVDFRNGAVVNEESLDLNALQAVHLAAETRDIVGSIPSLDVLQDTQNALQFALNRSNHVGSQGINTILGLQAALDSKLSASGIGNYIYAAAAPFNVVANGITDCAEGLEAAANFAAAANAKLILPSGTGTILCLRKITVSSANRIHWEGMGRMNTMLLWGSAAVSSGVDITYTNNQRAPKLTGIAFLTGKGAAASGDGLTITGPNDPSVAYLGPQLEDLAFLGGNVTSMGWSTAVHFRTCWNISTFDITIKGVDGSTVFTSQAGVKLTSCQVCWLDKLNIFHVDIGIVEAASGAGSRGEGFAFSNFEIVGCRKGIELRADGVAPGTSIGPGHINANERGVDLLAQLQTVITDILIYRTQSSIGTFVGINGDECAELTITGNTIKAPGVTGGSTYGVTLSGNTWNFGNIITNNRFAGFVGANRVGVALGAGISKTLVTNNVALDGTMTQFITVDPTAAKDNIIVNNFPVQISAFGSGDATPSVGNALGTHFRTAGTPETITALDDGYDGQLITVLCLAATNFTHTASLIMKGGVNYAAPSGCILTFVKDPMWREVSRSI